MERQLQRQDSDIKFERDHSSPSCLWSILQILDYHHWHSVKKILPHRRYRRERHIRCNESPRTIFNGRFITNVPEYLNDGTKPFLVKGTTKPLDADKRSRTPHIEVLITKENPRQESHEHRKFSFLVEPRLCRVNSVHHLEPSDYFLGDITKIGENPIMVTSSKQAAFSERYEVNRTNEKAIDTNRDIPVHQFTEHVDILEIFKVNKKLFVEMLQSPDFGTKTEIFLAKSKSFPTAENCRPNGSTPKHKQNEYFPRSEKLLPNAEASKFVASEPPKIRYKNSCVYSSKGLKHQRWNQSVIKRFNFIKQKIKRAFKESKKDCNSNYQCQCPDDGRNMPENLEITMSRDDVEDVRSSDNINDRFWTVTRTSSLNESIERYTQLFVNNFNREANCHRSRSLKLTNENTNNRGFFVRNLSLPDLDLFYSLFNHESHDPFHVVSKSRKNIEILDGLNFDEADKGTSGKDEHSEYIAEPENLENSHHKDQNIEPGPNDDIEISTPIQVLDLETCFDNPDFNYVRYLLQSSGLIENEKPLDSSLFKRLETCLHNEFECSGKEVSGNTDHQLLFGLVNETLLDIYERTYPYFPKSFPFKNHSIPEDQHLLDEVWARIIQKLNSGPELDQTLDDIVGRDLSKGDGWMKLEFEAEFVALELEGLILDELLEELFLS